MVLFNPYLTYKISSCQIILMGGLSRTALEDISSDRSFDDRIPHMCNILRFAILKKDHSFMAVGGPWESADGGDPSVDDNSLIRTALRFLLKTELYVYTLVSTSGLTKLNFIL